VTRKRLASAAVLAAAAVLAPSFAAAQPTPVPTPPPDEDQPPEGPTEPVAPTPPDPAVEEERIRAIVQAELAAERARQAAPAEAPAAAEEPKDEDYLSGDNGFVDVRLNLTLTNENLLAKPGETIPSVPGWRFGRPNSLGTLFFDNYDTRFSGYETLSHLVLYRNYRKEHLEAEAGFVMRINELSERNIALSDAGSYVLVSWWQDPTHTDPTRLSLTAFPVSADRFRLGYSYRLSWGGNEDTRNTSPGVKLQYDTGRAYAFVGAKSSVLLNRLSGEQEARMSVLAGAGFDVTPEVRIEANGGVFDRGNNELQDVLAETVQLFGGSLQVAVHHGMPVQSSIDYKLYKYDPERIGRVFQKAKYPGGVSWLAMAEATILGQTLKDPEATGSTKIQYGAAGDVNVRAMIDRTRVRVDLQYRDLAFILHSVPSLPTFSDFPQEYDIAPNFFAAVGADQNFQERYTVGAVVGLEIPATLTSPTGIPGDNTMTGESTAVIRNNGQQTLITILPADEKVAPQLAAKVTGQIDFGDIYSTVLDLYYSYDPNQTRLTRDDPEDTFRYEFGEFNQLGVNITLQAKF
jgi:hypothetical protein